MCTMSVSSALHRNVLLLTHLVPPNDVFKKHFREGMFDKPNTAGFVYVSHYLLTICDEQRFEKMVQWPVVCKKTEAKYRNDVKDLLTSVANENPDIGFPPILTSYLFHAGGQKFTVIMWKLSIVVLRVYIRKNCDRNILLAPKTGFVEDIAKESLKEGTSKIHLSIRDIHKDIAVMTEAAKATAMEETEALAKIKTELFERKQSLANAASEAPVDSSIKKRLSNVEDTDIIHMWKTSISESMNNVEKRYAIIRNIERLIVKTTGTVTNRLSGTRVLDMGNLGSLDSSKISTLPLPPESQFLLHRLCRNDKVVLQNFITLVALLLHQLYSRLKKSELTDLSKHLVQIEASYEDMKSAFSLFNDFLISITNTSTEMKNRLHQRDVCQIYNENIMPMMNNVLLTDSPLIKISADYHEERCDLQKRLELTPVEGAHKSLFSRYKRHTANVTPQASELRSNLLVSRINFDDVTSSSSSSLQTPQKRSAAPKANLTSVKNVGKYSRLFSTCVKKNNGRANYSLMSIPSSSKANSTAMINSTGEMPAVLELSLDITAKGLFNSSKEHLSMTPEKESTKRSESQNIFEEIEETEGIEGIIEPAFLNANMPETNGLTQVQHVTNSDTSLYVKVNEKTRRCSISDLVERYKKIIELKNHT